MLYGLNKRRKTINIVVKLMQKETNNPINHLQIGKTIE